jgi:LuxR family transcriptional regulator, maltose regulon positive regulatory protein
MTDTIAAIPVIPSKLEPRRSRPTRSVGTGSTPCSTPTTRVVVVRPAGYGKSTLVAGWVRRSPERRIAWVSLDPLDRNALSFWRHVTAAIDPGGAGRARGRRDPGRAGRPGPEFVAALAHALWDDGRPLVLVLDDLHHADPHAMRDELTTLVDRCRGLLRLVTISRTDPPLPTKRWLAEGRAVELRLDALAFRPDEAAALMHRFDVAGLGDADVERLNDHVEGWAVGLLLSGLTLEGRPDLAASLDDLIHSDRHLTDYLVDEVLDRLPDDLRDLALSSRCRLRSTRSSLGASPVGPMPAPCSNGWSGRTPSSSRPPHHPRTASTTCPVAAVGHYRWTDRPASNAPTARRRP